MITTERYQRRHTSRIRRAAATGLGAAAICALPGAVVAAPVDRSPQPPRVVASPIFVDRPLSQPASRSLHRVPIHRSPPVRHRAHASPSSLIPAVWLRVAHCESTLHWHDNTGNGYYGGLQIDASNARFYHFARADLLAPVEQLQLARLILRDQGPSAWPQCGPLAGLERGD